jgi:hypothetical protein
MCPAAAFTTLMFILKDLSARIIRDLLFDEGGLFSTLFLTPV